MTTRTPRPRRAGFTVVELLVAMALIILIMSILSQAFVEGLNTFRQLKGVGDMQDNLRTVAVPLRNDLILRHFDGAKKLSTGFGTTLIPSPIPGNPPIAVSQRPSEGFLRIQQGSASLWEGNDSDGLPSYRAANHILHLTIHRLGSRRADYPTVDAPGALAPGFQNTLTDPARWLWQEGPPDYQQPAIADPNNAGNYYPTQRGYMNGQWSEVMWFLVPMIDPDTGLQMTAAASDTLLFTLHRRERLMVSDNNDKLNVVDRIAATQVGQYPEIACRRDPVSLTALHFPSSKDMTLPVRRSMMDVTGTASLPQPIGTPYALTSAAAGLPAEDPARRNEDRVIADVISFEIKVLRPGSYRFEDIGEAMLALGMGAPPAGTAAYDTALWPVDKLILKAVQVTIRVWDAKTEQVRQITIIQDM